VTALVLHTESSRVQFGRTELEYQIRRTSRDKTVSLAVVPQQGLVVTAPRRATTKRLDSIVREKAAWVVRRLKRQSDLPPPIPQREFVSGETYLYLGRQYRLKIAKGAREAEVCLRAGQLHVPMQTSLAGSQVARAALIAWYKTRAADYLSRRAKQWAKKLGLEAPRLLVSEPRKRWGSASKDGSLRINWRVIQAPTTLVDYVLVHELAHLIHEDHSREFWATVGRVLPDYEERKARLRELGPKLVW